MRYKSTLLLLTAVIVAALVAYALSKKPTSEEMARQQGKLLPDLRASDVVKLELESGGRSIACERRAPSTNEWLITEPLHLRADRWEVEGILNRFETARKGGRPIQGGGERNLADYGLAEPRAKVTFHSAPPSTRTWSLLIGKEAGVGDLVFVTTGHGKPIYSVEKGVVDKVDATVNDLRSKHLADEIKLGELTGVQIAAAKWGDKDAVEVACNKRDGAWELTSPARDLADGKAIEKLAELLSQHYLSANDFMVDDPTKAAEYGLDNPALSLTFQSGEVTDTFVFGQRQEADQQVFYAMNKAEPAIVKVSRSLFEDLRKGPEDLRLRSLVQFRKEDAQGITITKGQLPLALQKHGAEWQIAGDKLELADGSAVEGMLDGLSKATVESMAADEPPQPADYGLDAEAAWTVAVNGAEGRVLAQVQFGAANDKDGIVYARRGGYPPVLAVEAAAYVRDIKRGRLAFLNRLVVEDDETRAVRIYLSNGQGEFVCERKDAAANWTLTKPIEGRADGPAVSALLHTFASLKAQEFAAESADDLTPYALDKPQVTAEVTYPEPTEERDAGAAPKTHARRLLVGAHTTEEPPGFFARLDGDARVFIISAQVVDVLQANLASRLICEAEGIEKLQFEGEGRSLSFAYDKEAHVWKDATGQPLPDELLQNVEKAANNLAHFVGIQVAAYVEKDPATYGFDKPALTIYLKDEAAVGKTVILGRETEAGRYVKGPASSFILVAGTEDANALLAVVRAPAEDNPTPQPAP